MLEQLPMVEIGIVAFCVFLSALFSSAETALTAMSEREARQLVESGEKKYLALKLWIKAPNKVLTTILIGNNLVNIFASAMATVVAAKLVQKDQAVALATGVMTFLVLIFGEVAPKTFAKYNHKRLAPRAISALRLFYWLVFPLTVALTGFSRFLVRIVGGEISRTGPFVTEEDISYLIDLGHREGVIEEHEEQLLHSVIEFSNTTVREIMIPRTEMIAVETDVERDELVSLVTSAGHSRIPVYEETPDNIVGIFYAKDLIKMPVAGKPFQLSTGLRSPYFVPEVMSIADLLKDFQRLKTHMAIVVDEYGGTSGIVTLEDILEEIVGEIHDEYDSEESQFRTLPGGKMLADGRISIDDLGEKLGRSFPESDLYETLGGFLTARAGKLPTKGTRLSWSDLNFTIIEADQRRIRRVEIERINDDEIDLVRDDDAGNLQSA